MKVDEADLPRGALEGSTGVSGCKMTLDRLNVHSRQIGGNALVVDAVGRRPFLQRESPTQ